MNNAMKTIVLAGLLAAAHVTSLHAQVTPLSSGDPVFRAPLLFIGWRF